MGRSDKDQARKSHQKKQLKRSQSLQVLPMYSKLQDQYRLLKSEGRPYCDNRGLSRLDNQSIERDRLIGIGFVLDFVEFISFTFGDKEMISLIEAVSR
ncbi:hypothetical protein Tco_0016713 [Tanacetum coccineum]